MCIKGLVSSSSELPPLFRLLLQVAPAQAPKIEEPEVDEAALREAEADALVNVAPKKVRDDLGSRISSRPPSMTPFLLSVWLQANWDLKRDVEKRLEKLERRTMRALLEMAKDEEAARDGAEAGAGEQEQG